MNFPFLTGKLKAALLFFKVEHKYLDWFVSVAGWRPAPPGQQQGYCAWVISLSSWRVISCYFYIFGLNLRVKLTIAWVAAWSNPEPTSLGRTRALG